MKGIGAKRIRRTSLLYTLEEAWFWATSSGKVPSGSEGIYLGEESIRKKILTGLSGQSLLPQKAVWQK